MYLVTNILPKLLVLTLLLGMAAHSHSQEALRHASEVRALPPDRALEGVPVELEAVVGFMEAHSSGTVFVQDETGGTFFRATNRKVPLHVGDRVRLKGLSMPGLYLTGINATTYEVLGSGLPPKPAVAGYEDLATGRYHYQMVQVEGIGRRVAMPEENRSVLFLAMGTRVVELRVDEPLPADKEAWVDARIQVSALAAGGINDRRQLVFPYLRVSSWQEVKIVAPARPLEEVDRLSAARLLRFDPARTQDFGHRVRLAGTVLAAFPDGQVFLRDPEPEPSVPSSQGQKPPNETGRPAAAAVRLVNASALKVGQTADVAGFPNMEGFSASLADAVLLDTGEGTEGQVEAARVTLKQLLGGQFDADLVQTEAELVDLFRTGRGKGWELRLLAQGGTLRALLPEVRAPELLRTGAWLNITGICRVETSTDSGFRSRPESAMLLMRSAEDLHVLRAPSWWTSQRLAGLVAVLLAVVAAGLLWISVLRRQVAKQAETLKGRVAHEAVLEERQRIAREFHDTLEQELAGLSLRLDAAVTRPLEEKARALLTTSRHLVSRIQTEARNLVSDLRADPLEATDLPAALHELADRVGNDTLTVEVRIQEGLPALQAHAAHHLRMIAQEAVTNVIKHARASRIILELGTDSNGKLKLSIRDDGQGMKHDSSAGMAGHFGCMGIRERCQKLGANVQWLSPEDGGTEVRVMLSVNSED